MRKLEEQADLDRLHREFIASLHVGNTTRAKEKLEELAILAPLTDRVSERHFKLWTDVMWRAAVERPEIAGYGIGLFDEWACMFEDAIGISSTVLYMIASILSETRCNLLEYHPTVAGEEVIRHLDRVADRYGKIAKLNKNEHK